jgi:hypothetical protein
VKIRFFQDYQVKDAEGREFKKGEVYDLPPDSARHFLNRRRAEAVGIEAPTPAPEPAAGPSVLQPIPPEEDPTAAKTEEAGEKSTGSPAPSVQEKPLGGEGDALKAFHQGQSKYRRRKLSGSED